jgi:hypothetical protein
MKTNFTLILFFLFFVSVANAQSSYTFSTTTYSSSTTNSTLITYSFSNGCTISNNNTKAYGTGSSSCIKYSSGTQYTINFPASVNVSSVTFYGYDNYTGKKSFFSEVNGATATAWNDSTQYFFTAKNPAVVMSTVTFIYTTPVTTSTYTYTPAGNQIVSTITVNYTTGGTTGVQNIALDLNANKPTNVYSIDGRRIKTNVFRSVAAEGLQPGIYIIDNQKVVVYKK